MPANTFRQADGVSREDPLPLAALALPCMSGTLGPACLEQAFEFWQTGTWKMSQVDSACGRVLQRALGIGVQTLKLRCAVHCSR